MIKIIITVRGGVVQAVSANQPELVSVVIDDRDSCDIGPALVDEFEFDDEVNFNSLIESLIVE